MLINSVICNSFNGIGEWVIVELHTFSCNNRFYNMMEINKMICLS